MPIRKPLADLIRPKDLSQFVGQKDLIEKDVLFIKLLKNMCQSHCFSGDHQERERLV